MIYRPSYCVGFFGLGLITQSLAGANSRKLSESHSFFELGYLTAIRSTTKTIDAFGGILPFDVPFSP